MKKFLIGIVSLVLIGGCTTPIKDKTYIAPPPVKTASAVPTHKKVADKIDSIAKSSEKIDKFVTEQKTAVLDQRMALVEATAQAARIKERAMADQLIDKIEAQQLVANLDIATKKNFFLETKVAELQKEITFQKTEVWFARRDAGVLLTQLTAKEGEANALRTLNEDLGKKLGDRDKDVASLKKDNAQKDAKIARNGVYRNWIIGSVSVLLFLAIAAFVAKRYGLL